MSSEADAGFTAQAQRFLSTNPDIERVELIFPDLNGVLRGKWLPSASLGKLSSGAVRLPSSTYCLDIFGDDVQAAAHSMTTGDPDGIGIPVPGTLGRTAWTRPPSAHVVMSLLEKDGRTPCPWDPRQVLASVTERFQARGWTPVVACELEFNLIDPHVDGRGHAQPPISPVTGGRLSGSQMYELRVLQEFGPVMTEISACCEAQGVPADTTIAEFGHGQFEVNLLHQANAMLAADHALLLKRTIRGVARRHGFDATFMAKPYGDVPGNGLHVHFSILDEDGRNIFSGADGRCAELLLFAVGGLLATAPDSQLVFAPHENSYRRFRPDSYAPVTAQWGYDNRNAAIRLPATQGPAARLEHRIAGADANVYLALAAILSGAMRGMERRIQPGEPIEGPVGDTAQSGLTSAWLDAQGHFRKSEFVRECLGVEFQEAFAAIKDQESTVLGRTITNAEFDAYLRTV